jgi:hypothetical protein
MVLSNKRWPDVFIGPMVKRHDGEEKEVHAGTVAFCVCARKVDGQHVFLGEGHEE